MGASRTPHAIPPQLAALCDFVAAMTRPRPDAAREALLAARAAGARRKAAEECGLMLMLYAGYPAALESLRVLHECWPGRARRTPGGSPAAWRARGEQVCRRVYGPAYAKLVPAVETLHPDLATFMIEHGYGRVLARPGLGLRERELLTVAALGALGWERQLVSHLLGARRSGASDAAIAAALERGLASAPASARATGRRALARLQAAGGERLSRRG